MFSECLNLVACSVYTGVCVDVFYLQCTPSLEDGKLVITTEKFTNMREIIGEDMIEVQLQKELNIFLKNMTHSLNSFHHNMFVWYSFPLDDFSGLHSHDQEK